MVLTVATSPSKIYLEIISYTPFTSPTSPNVFLKLVGKSLIIKPNFRLMYTPYKPINPTMCGINLCDYQKQIPNPLAKYNKVLNLIAFRNFQGKVSFQPISGQILTCLIVGLNVIEVKISNLFLKYI